MEAEDSNTWGTTSTKEFTPRWADLSQGLKILQVPGQGEAVGATSVTVEGAGPYSLSVEIDSPQSGPLRLTSFFFPGWRALLDGHQLLATYPSTNLGLLTIDIPAGLHQLNVAWTAVPVQQFAAVLSLLSLAVLAWFCWRQADRAWLSIALLPVLVAGAWASAWPDQPPGRASNAASRLAGGGLQFAGFRYEMAEDTRALYLYPYWYVTSQPVPDMLVHWQLRDESQHVLAETLARPYFGSLHTGDWTVRDTRR